MLGVRQARRFGGELLFLRRGREAVVGLGVKDDVSEQFLAERGQRALPELARGLSLPDEYPLLRGDGAGIHPVGEVVDGAARDRIAFLDGPFDRGETAMPGQERGVIADT